MQRLVLTLTILLVLVATIWYLYIFRYPSFKVVDVDYLNKRIRFLFGGKEYDYNWKHDKAPMSMVVPKRGYKLVVSRHNTDSGQNEMVHFELRRKDRTVSTLHIQQIINSKAMTSEEAQKAVEILTPLFR